MHRITNQLCHLQHITYATLADSSRSYLEKVLICESREFGRSLPYKSAAFRESLVIPPLPPTDEVTSKICKTRYTLKLIGKTSSLHRDIDFDFPITIGSYPILEELNITSYPTQEPVAATAHIPNGVTAEPTQATVQRRILPIAWPTYAPTAPMPDVATNPRANAQPSAPFPDDGKFTRVLYLFFLLF